MLNRWLGILSLGAMAIANSYLVVRDLLPMWIAEEPPRHGAMFLRPGESIKIQVGIFDSNGGRIGTAWTYTRAVAPTDEVSGPKTGPEEDDADFRATSPARIRVFSRTNLNPIRLPGNIVSPAVVIRSSLLFNEQGLLDDLDIGLDGLGTSIKLKGERFSATDFACQWQVGERRGTFMLPDSATRALGDVIRPFDTLPELYVGRTWRMELVNPLAHLMPNMDRGQFDTESVLVRVAAEETIRHGNQDKLVFRVEAPNVTAWVTPEGRVLRQEVKLPVLGATWTLVDEVYNDKAWYSGGAELDPD